MLRVSARTIHCRSGVFAPVFLSGPHRSISHGLANHADALTRAPLDEPATKGVEGMHRADKMNSTAPSGSLMVRDGVSTLPPPIRADWVLFHPVYTTEELGAVEITHREAKTFKEKFAYFLVRVARKTFDLASGYRHKPMPDNYKEMSVGELRKGGYILSDQQWLDRILFLETIAAVPGMVAAAVRHLQSVRLMRRDSGWIHTLLEEAENERMHLMTFMTLRKPSLPFRALVIGAQGVFYNLFFLSYILSPRTCHRFVGYLEEEAVITYTRCLAHLDHGLIPEWAGVPAPSIAIDYWRLSPDASLRDVIAAVRADETTHRFVNHSLSNLDPKTDVNPFALREPDMLVKGTSIGFERVESEQYVRDSHEMLAKQNGGAVPPP